MERSKISDGLGGEGGEGELAGARTFLFEEEAEGGREEMEMEAEEIEEGVWEDEEGMGEEEKEGDFLV